MKKRMLWVSLLLVIVVLLSSCSDKVGEVEEKIKEIGTVTLDSETVILEAEEAYAALSSGEQEKVTNSAELTDARAQYDHLARVNNVEEKISSIGSVSLQSEAAITEAEEAYAALSSDEQAEVRNYEDLVNARSRFDSLSETARRERADREEVISLSGKILTKMGTIFKSPLNLTVLNVWYSHYKSGGFENWYITYQLSAPNGYGTDVTEYYGVSLLESEGIHNISQLDETLTDELRYWNTLGHGIVWKEDDVNAMQNGGTQLDQAGVEQIQDYYIKNIKTH